MFKTDKLFIFNVKHTTLASIIEDRIQEGQEFFVSLNTVGCFPVCCFWPCVWFSSSYMGFHSKIIFVMPTSVEPRCLVILDLDEQSTLL